MLINKEIPEFKLEAYVHPEFAQVSKKDLLGHWSILFFYPADFTFVCPTELEDMADNYKKFKELGVEVYSVSTDTHFSHFAWHDSSEKIKKIKFPMLADPKAELTKALDVYVEEAGLAYRGTFVVDPDGIIKLVEINDNNIGRNADELLRKVQAAQFVREHGDQVCPAKWQPKGETLKPGIDLVGKL